MRKIVVRITHPVMPENSRRETKYTLLHTKRCDQAAYPLNKKAATYSCKNPPNAVNSHRVPRPKGNRPPRYRIHATNQLFIATDTSSKTHATLVDFYSLT